MSATDLHASRAVPGTAQMLAESPAAATTRAGTVLPDLRDGVVLFGAGSLGRKVLAAVRGAGVEPLGFADNNAALQGKPVEGLSVFVPAEAARRWGGSPVFVVTVFLPTGDAGLAGRIAALRQLGCARVVTFVELGWSLPGVLPHFAAERPDRLLAHAAELQRVGALWQDERSREVFRQQLGWRLHARFEEISKDPDQYFPRDLLRPNPDEEFVDGGAFDGDTLRRAPWPFRRVWAIEPDPASAGRLRATMASGVTVHETALGREAGVSRFNAGGHWGSARSDTGNVEVRVQKLDALLMDGAPTFVKLDIEGDELAALEGCRATLERCQPVVAVCVYHRPEDLWTIPLYLRAVLPRHRLFLRVHENDGFELVAYAIPPERNGSA